MAALLEHRLCARCAKQSIHWKLYYTEPTPHDPKQRDSFYSCFCSVCGKEFDINHIFHWCSVEKVYQDFLAAEGGWKCSGCGLLETVRESISVEV